MTQSTHTLTAIGHVRGGRLDPVDDDWGSIEATIVLDPDQFTQAVVAGLADFSHVEVLFVFDKVDPAKVNLTSRRPRGNPDWPEVGIFAQRAKARPNRLGLTTCELVAVDGLEVRVRGLDAIDGTPVVDLKPFMAEFAPRGEVRQPAWSSELMRQYW